MVNSKEIYEKIAIEIADCMVQYLEFTNQSIDFIRENCIQNEYDKQFLSLLEEALNFSKTENFDDLTNLVDYVANDDGLRLKLKETVKRFGKLPNLFPGETLKMIMPEMFIMICDRIEELISDYE